MLNFLLAIALGNPFPSLKPLSPELPALIASTTPALRVRVDKKPYQLQGDFNNDRTPDTLLLVAVDRQLPPKIEVHSPWKLGQMVRLQIPEPLAIYIRHGSNGREFLLHNRDYFSTPQWQNARLPMRIVTRRTPEHRRWFLQGADISGDGILLPTEAGIDILLFWDGVKYKVFFPRETP